MRPPLPAQDLELVLQYSPEFLSRFHGARILLTGGTGFIGLWLLEALQHANRQLDADLRMVVLTRDPNRARRQAPHLFNRADTQLVCGNICQLLTSSGAVYGKQPANLELMSEDHCGAADPLQPQAAYGNGKRAAEWLASTCAVQGGLEACMARIFAVVGPGLSFDGPLAAGNFVRDVLAGQPIYIEGDGRPLRSYLYMADLCIWLLRIAASGQSGRAYNVGSEHAVSISELAGKVAHAAGRTTPIRIHKPASSPALPPRYVPDTRRARDELGLAEYTPLHVALLKTVHWSRSAAVL